MLFLCLAILSSCAIALLMRISAEKISAKMSMLCSNYLVCSLLGGAYAGFDLVCPNIPGFSVAVVLGIISGILYLSSFVLFQWNTAKNGIVLSSIFMKLGLLVPMALSVLFFRELPTWPQIIGFCMALVAIVLINFKNDHSGSRFRWQLVLMLLLCGGADAMIAMGIVMAITAIAMQFVITAAHEDRKQQAANPEN